MIQSEEITDEFRFYLLRKRRAEDLILAAFRGFRKCGVEPILIKGWAAARNYPDSHPRFSGDIDLAVSNDDYEIAVKIIADPDSGVAGVDLHRELRHLETLDWSELYSNSQLIDLDGEPIRVLCPEDHLRVLCIHWLTDGGEDRERLWDIFYAVENRPADFDWGKCLDVVNRHRRTWIVSAIGLAHKYLGLKLDGLPFAAEARDLPEWLTTCVEREWSANLTLRPLHTALDDRRILLQQIKKRIPPNPIQASIDCEAPFDHGSRVGYQVRDVFKRLGPSLKRVLPAIIKR